MKKEPDLDHREGSAFRYFPGTGVIYSRNFS